MEFDRAAFAGDPATEKALGFLDEARWRKARDEAKKLCKSDRERYLPLLVAANAGLAREMIGKSLHKEAGTVIDHLQTIAPGQLVETLRAELEAGASRTPEESAAVRDAALRWQAALRADAAVEAGGEIAPDDRDAVDGLVTDPGTPEIPDGDERAARVAAELAAVRAALDATGDGRWEEAKETLREVPARSVFRHWRMFLRGVRCVFEGDRETARKCFAGLPEDGAPAMAARAVEPDYAPPGPAAPAAARTSFFLAATGSPKAWAEPITAAGESWAKGARMKAFTTLRKGMKKAFPDYRPGLASMLTDAMLPYRPHMDEDDADFADQLYELYGADPAKNPGLHAHGALALFRAATVGEPEFFEPETLEGNWAMVLEAWRHLEGADATRDAVAWRWLGERLAHPQSSDTPFAPPPEPDLRRARRALEKAVDRAPDDVAAWISLADVISRQGDSKTRRKMIDDLAARFPNDKKVMVLAGTEALDRGSHTKALKSLRAALTLDPLDREVKELILVTLVGRLRARLKKGRDVAGDWEEMEPLLEDRARAGHLMTARWVARIRRGVLDPDPEGARAAREDAARLAPSDPERLFLEAMMTKAYRVDPRKDWQPEWNAACAGGSIGWKGLRALLELADFANRIREWRGNEIGFVIERLAEAVKSLTGDRLWDDPGGLLAFLDEAAALEKRLTDNGSRMVNRVRNGILESLETEIPADGPKAEPRLLMARLVILETDDVFLWTPAQEVAEELDEVTSAAKEAGMEDVVRRAEAMRARLGPMEESGGDSFADPFDQGPAGAVMDDLLALLEAYMAALESGNRKATADAEEGLRALGCPEELLAKAAAKAGGGMKNAAPKKKTAKKKAAKKKSAGKPPPSDPNQLDLF